MFQPGPPRGALGKPPSAALMPQHPLLLHLPHLGMPMHPGQAGLIHPHLANSLGSKLHRPHEVAPMAVKAHAKHGL